LFIEFTIECLKLNNVIEFGLKIDILNIDY